MTNQLRQITDQGMAFVDCNPYVKIEELKKYIYGEPEHRWKTILDIVGKHSDIATRVLEELGLTHTAACLRATYTSPFESPDEAWKVIDAYDGPTTPAIALEDMPPVPDWDTYAYSPAMLKRIGLLSREEKELMQRPRCTSLLFNMAIDYVQGHKWKTRLMKRLPQVFEDSNISTFILLRVLEIDDLADAMEETGLVCDGDEKWV